MEGDHCTRCHRQVHDLSAMSEPERSAFLASCKGEICVSYALPFPRTIAAAAMSASLLAAGAAAAETPPPQVEKPQATSSYEDADKYQTILIFTGGIKDVSNAAYIDTAEDLAIPEIPVVYEDDRTREN